MTRKPVPSAANGATRLRQVGKEAASVPIKVKLDDAEYDAIAARAADCKLSVQRFLLSCAYGSPQLRRRRRPRQESHRR